MAIKNFKYEGNQKAWDVFFNVKTVDEGKPRTSINQYKPVLLALESELDQSFDNMSVDGIKAFMEAREGKNQNHLNGFMVFCVTNKLIAARKDLILYLIPKDYGVMIRMLFQD